MNKQLIISLLLLSFTISVVGQNFEEIELLNVKENWFDGSILLSSGKEFKGPIKYDASIGLVAYHDGTESHAYRPRSVVGFEFFDEKDKTQRVFYSMEYEEEGISQYYFFEVLKDFKEFAVLSSVSRVNVVIRDDPYRLNNYTYGTGTPTYSKKTTFEQAETIFFMDAKGEITPYFKVILKEDGWVNLSSGEDIKQKGEMVNKDLILKFISKDDWATIQKYMDENKLKMTRKTDFIQIVNYYASIRP